MNGFYGRLEISDAFPQPLTQLRNLIYTENQDYDEQNNDKLTCSKAKHR